MEQELISKKELLKLTEISYGQLYRWKRERLLPEEWFIKRSSFTGQETVFPRVQILERVKAIKELKDDLSLEAIAELLRPQSGDAIAMADLDKVLDVDPEYLTAIIERLSMSSKESDAGHTDIDSGDGEASEHLSFSEVVFIGALGALVADSTLDSLIAAQLAYDGRDLSRQWISETFACEVLAVTHDSKAASPAVHSQDDASSKRQEPEDSSPTSWHLVLFKEGAPPAFSRNITRVAPLPLEATSAAIKQKLSGKYEENKEEQ